MKNYPSLRRLHYQITPSDHAALRSRLAAQGERGRAGHVHRLYFTSYRNRVPGHPMDELLGSGGGPRFSLQYGDNDPSYLTLERWEEGERTTAMVAEAECRALLSGETGWLLERHNPVLVDFYESLTERMLLPQVLVSYQREVYTPEGQGMWVALDTDIRASLQHMDFLDPQRLAASATGLDGRILMEVGYTEEFSGGVISLIEESTPRRKLLEG